MRLTRQRLVLSGMVATIATVGVVHGFTSPAHSAALFPSTQNRRSLSVHLGQLNEDDINIQDDSGDHANGAQSRRQMMAKAVALASASFLPAVFGSPQISSAALGTLPEFADTNAIVQGLTINVADASQQKSMIEFLIGAFDFVVQRQRIQGTVEETVS